MRSSTGQETGRMREGREPFEPLGVPNVPPASGQFTDKGFRKGHKPPSGPKETGK